MVLNNYMLIVVICIVIILLYFLLLLLRATYRAGKWGKKKKDYAQRQIGGTCGFYAMAYVYQRLTYANPDSMQELCTKVITKMIDAGYSYVGEIFSVEKFLIIWNDCFAEKLWNKNIDKVHLNNNNSISNIMKDIKENKNGKCYYIIPSCSKSGSCPHYYVVWQNENEVYSWDGNQGKQSCDLEQLIQRQKNMKKKYNLMEYIKWHPLLWKIFGWDDKIRNKALFKYLLKKEQTVRKHVDKELLNIKIELEGYCFRIG